MTASSALPAIPWSEVEKALLFALRSLMSEAGKPESSKSARGSRGRARGKNNNKPGAEPAGNGGGNGEASQPVTNGNASESADKPRQSAESRANGGSTTPSTKAGKPKSRRYRVSQRRKELDALGSKYKVFSLGLEVVRVILTPSDPEFAFPIPVLDFDLHIPRNYPHQGPPPYIGVNNEDIPRGNAINLENAFKSPSYTGTLSDKVHRLDMELESLLTLPAAKTFTIVRGKKPAGSQVTPESMAALEISSKGAEQQKSSESNAAETDPAALAHPSASDAAPNAERGAGPGPDADSDASSDAASDSDSGADSASDTDSSGSDYEPDYMHSSDEEDIDSGVSHDTSKPKREGTEIVFHDIKLTNIALCEIVSLNILFQCGRCKTLHTFNNLQSAEYGKPSKPRAEICSKCDLPLMVAFRKEYLHSMSHTAGYLDLDGGKVADLLPSSYVAMCGQCQTMSPIFKNVDMGAQRMVNCRNCHAKLWIQLELFEFVLLSTETLAPAAKRIEREKLPAQAPKQKLHLTGGEPLPNYGACEHYRKSLRWFRFSCCQRVFACDRCHDAEMQHPSDPASRMLCGYCSREQRFSSKCFYCEHDYTQRITRFWEGGKGVRDRKLMSRKDKRKYKRDPVEKKKSSSHFKGKSKDAPKH